MSEGYAGDVLFSLGIPLLFHSELYGLRIYFFEDRFCYTHFQTS